MIKDLFVGTSAAPKRPTARTIPNLYRRVAEELLPEVKLWSGGDLGPDEEVLDDLEKALKDTVFLDGYAIARRLENNGWYCVNAELVETLDGSGGILWQIERVSVKEWVTSNEIRSSLTVGTTVKTPRGTGRIFSILEETAEYIVQTDEFLEKNPTQAGKGGGAIVAFEDVELCPAEAVS